MEKWEFEANLNNLIAIGAGQPDRLNGSLGLSLLGGSPGGGEAAFAEFRYDSKPQFLNPYGGVHGGIISALIDTCAGYGIVALTGKAVSTTDISVSFLRALRADSFRIRVEFTHIGSKLASAMVRVMDLFTGEVCATGMITFIVMDYRMPWNRE